jgi:hypothetical protein
VVGAFQDASRIPALPELEEPLDPELEELLDPELEEPLEPRLEELLVPELEEALAPELTVAELEPDELPDSSHPLASRTALSARANLSRRRIEYQSEIAHGLPTAHHAGGAPPKYSGSWTRSAPRNAIHMRASRTSVRWLSLAPIHCVKG